MNIIQKPLALCISTQISFNMVSKYRKPCFTVEILKRLEQICPEQCKKCAIELIAFGGEKDHIHLLLDMHPNMMPSRFINSLKAVYSRLILKNIIGNLCYGHELIV